MKKKVLIAVFLATFITSFGGGYTLAKKLPAPCDVVACSYDTDSMCFIDGISFPYYYPLMMPPC